MFTNDIIIIGSGIAALQTAIESSKSKNVRIITKTKLKDSNSYLAQGGVAAAFSEHDSPALHGKDTVDAGRNYNDQAAVNRLVEKGPSAIRQLIEDGMCFDKDEIGNISLGMEGAHSVRRILHFNGDATGKGIINHLLDKLFRTNIIISECETAIELLVNKEGHCVGVMTVDEEGRYHRYFAPHVVIATGGCGALYEYTSNSPNATGDGIALAIRAGAVVRDMEFIQFHPTLLYSHGSASGLISEAVRGEGAILVNEYGMKIMEGQHVLKDLAPRHVVSQTIFSHLETGDRVYLDISMIQDFEIRFPSIANYCMNNGIDLTKGRIPVAPGSHFLMGGIAIDAIGQTSIPGLYAVGEASCSGLHGANRLASNSLLEGLVYGKELGKYLSSQTLTLQSTDYEYEDERENPPLQLPNESEIKKMMMCYVGIVRDEKGLRTIKEWLESYDLASILYISLQGQTLEKCKVIMMLINAWIITESALLRTESRGGHFRSDFPFENDYKWRNRTNWFTRNHLISTKKGTALYEQAEAKTNAGSFFY
ncbi:L-aspartate oxidase [Peribacillus alkalitolerans]|uniref:L-aspartate oxidase n=1 Tax=Peribacillus alkalitolerans TaxID=1550385 RepID=UPI0013D103C1|nr:L-aspartate oxidase [Peribacillus alkalitolerans]